MHGRVEGRERTTIDRASCVLVCCSCGYRLHEGQGARMKVGWRGDIVGAVRADKKTRAVCQRESLRHTKESSARAITPEEEAQAQQGASQGERQHTGYTRARRVEARVWP